MRTDSLSSILMNSRLRLEHVLLNGNTISAFQRDTQYLLISAMPCRHGFSMDVIKLLFFLFYPAQ